VSSRAADEIPPTVNGALSSGAGPTGVDAEAGLLAASAGAGAVELEWAVVDEPKDVRSDIAAADSAPAFDAVEGVPPEEFPAVASPCLD